MEEYQYEYISTKIMAEHLMIPAPTVVRILKNLNASGITIAKEGTKGGYILARSISEITLLDVFLAIERGPMFKTHGGLDIEYPEIERVTGVVKNCLLDAEHSMKGSLKKTTLADIFNST